jgi:hypothetical protein
MSRLSGLKAGKNSDVSYKILNLKEIMFSKNGLRKIAFPVSFRPEISLFFQWVGLAQSFHN